MKQSFIIILIIVAILGIGFYWYQWRPAEIRKECIGLYPKAFEEYFDNSKLGMLSNFTNKDIENYEKCLRERGLDK